MAGHGSSTKAILYALLANLGIAVMKTGAAIYTGSGSMLAEAIHSFADTGNQILLFFGINSAKKEPDKNHPLGYGKVIYFWSFIVALLLFSMGGMFSIYEGVHKLSHHEEMNQAWLALTVLGISILLEMGSLMGAVKEINLIKKKKSLLQWLKESREAELVVVFGEDVAAMVGLTFAFIFILISMITRNPIYDAMGSIVIGVVLVIVSLFVATKVKSMLIGRSADPEMEGHIHGLIRDNEQIVDVLNIITIQHGPDVMLAVKIRLKDDLPVRQAAEEINKMEVRIKQEFPEIRWIFMEPDIVS